MPVHVGLPHITPTLALQRQPYFLEDLLQNDSDFDSLPGSSHYHRPSLSALIYAAFTVTLQDAIVMWPSSPKRQKSLTEIAQGAKSAFGVGKGEPKHHHRKVPRRQ